MLVKRETCDACHYPVATCVCHAVTPVKSRISITVLQHPTEAGHAKNTVRLLALLLSNVEIIVGDKGVDFSALKERLPAETLVVYPSDGAQSLTSLARARRQFQHIVLLDGSWRQAKKIWLSNAWLCEFDCVTIESEAESFYIIRKAPDASHLSTLEAAAITLNKLDNVPLKPFYSLLDTLTNNWRKFLPQ